MKLHEKYLITEEPVSKFTITAWDKNKNLLFKKVLLLRGEDAYSRAEGEMHNMKLRNKNIHTIKLN